ncbi:MAG: hypothetical protein FWD24_04210 [Treponema sp.]|nr:hypothetical protein [Treponema sp.]
MKTRTIGVYAVAVAFLLVAALLVTNCLDPIGGFLTSDFNNTAGKSVLTINFDDSNARTVMPTFPTGTITYELTIINVTNPGTPIAVIEDQAVNFGTTVSETLPDGTYDVTVIQFVDGEAVTGNTDQVVMNGANNSITINLKPIADGVDDGTFAWDFTLPTNLTGTAVMSFAILGGGGTVSPITVSGGNNDNDEDIPSGFYRVTVTFTQTGFITARVQETVHIGANMTSTWTQTFPELIPNVYTVTYNGNTQDSGSPPPAETAVPHGGMIDDAPTHDLLKTNYTQNGWGTRNGLSDGNWGTIFSFNDTTGTRVIGNLTLFARWISDAGFPLTVTITQANLTDLMLGTIPGSSASINQTDIYAGTAVPSTFSITMDNTTADLENFRWYYGNVELTNTLTGIAISGTENIVLTVNLIQVINTASIMEMSAAGTHVIGVTATKDGLPYAALVTYDVVNNMP